MSKDQRFGRVGVVARRVVQQVQDLRRWPELEKALPAGCSW